MRAVVGSHQKSFLRSVGRTAAFNSGAALISATTGILLARWLGTSGRGDYAAVTSYFTLTLVFFELGLGSSVMFHVSKDKRRHADYVWTAITLLMPLAIAAGLVSMVAGVTIFDGSSARRSAFLLLPAAIILSFASAPALFVLQSLALRKWNVVRLSQPIAFFMLVVGAHFMVGLTVPLVINFLSVSLAVQTGLAWLFYVRVGGGRGRFKRELVRPLLHFGVLNMSSTAPNAVNGRLDQMVLALMVSSASLGQYAVAVSLSTLAAPVVVAFGYVAFPSLARGERMRETIASAARGALIVSVATVLVIVLASPFVVPRLFGSGYGSVTRLLFVLAPGAVVVVVNQVLGDLLRGLGRPGAVALCEGLGVASTVLGLVLLVPRLGVMGAAVTSSVTYVVIYALLFATVARHASALRVPTR